MGVGHLTPCFVPWGGVLYTVIVLGGGFLPPSSRVLGVCPGGGEVMDEIDTCISTINISLPFVKDWFSLFYSLPYKQGLRISTASCGL